jgi:uncharacterized protein YbjT (DUF2867 family)
MKKILVLGGTGLLGQPVAQRLRRDGFEVRILSRKPQAAAAALGDGFEIVAGDVADTDSLGAAMEGCYGVHISVGGPVDRLSAENVVAAAPAAAIELITYLSGSTVSRQNAWFPMVEQKLMAERALSAGETPYTVFCPTWPMEQLPRFVIGGRVMLIGEQSTPLHWFAAADLARMVSHAFRSAAAANRRLYVHGPEALTMKEALERFCGVAHPEVESIGVMPIDSARATAEAAGDQMLTFMTEMMAYFDQAGELGDPTEANELLGAPTITLDDWLSANYAPAESRSDR